VTDLIPERVVIVGAGHGGANAAALLRQHGYTGTVTLVGTESTLPYQRPPLSKDFLKQKMTGGELLIKPEHFYEEQDIDLMLGANVDKIDVATRTVHLSGSEPLEYDALVLATGASARRLDVPGADLSGVCELRTRDDADRLGGYIGPGSRVLVVGGGYVGLEVAASAQHLGAEVTVLEREARVLARVASPELAAWLTDHHLGEGTEIITSADVAEFVDRGDGAVGAVRLADGREFACDVALVGVGAIPCDDLAREAGLLCEGGIVVDAAARTSDASVFAIGDVTRRPLHHYEGAHRLESIPSAVEQAKQATCAILGEPGPRPEVPWFWSDQFDVKVKIAGLLLGVDTTVRRGDAAAAKFALYHLREGHVVAVETVNSGPDFMAGKQLIDHQTPVDPARLADPAVSLRELAS
jgi:3-phenylpropionate/trans-cinnamate dioxygenase ferredoxin reductase subunit